MKRSNKVFSGFPFAGLMLAVLLFSCSNEKAGPVSNEEMIIVYVEFMHEVNSFSPVITTERDFRADHLFYGEEARTSGLEEEKQLAGFLEVVEKLGKGNISTIPLVHAKSMSGGPVDSVFYGHNKSTILEGIAAQPRVDGIYLSMHGAMGVQGMHDPEGEILEAVRN